MPKIHHRWMAGALVASLLLAACTSEPDDSASGGSTDGSATGSATDSPNVHVAATISDGAIDDAVGELDGLVERTMATSGVPGVAVAVVHDQELIYAEGFGVREVGTDRAVDADTVFQLASVSKAIGATVIANAVGQGTVSWDDPVSRYISNVELADPYVAEHVTIADLYSHRSGLPEHAGDLLEDLGFTQEDVFAKLADYPLTPFRTEAAYTNFGLTLGAEAVAAAADTPWAELSEQLLYEPLGMTSTSSLTEDYEAAPNKAVLHRKVDDEWVTSSRDPDAQSAAGGVSSSVNDLAKWMNLQLANGDVDGEQLIDEGALLEMRTPHIITAPMSSPSARTTSFGLGIMNSTDQTGRVQLTHSGAFAMGAATAFTLLPAEDLGIVVLTNGQPMGVPETITASFIDLVETGEVSRDWLDLATPTFEDLLANHSDLAGETPPSYPAPAQPNAAYVGLYDNELYGTAEVTEAGDGSGLVLRLGDVDMPLQHWDGDQFAFTPPGENSEGISALYFDIDGANNALLAEFYDADGLGTFVRAVPEPAA